MIKEINVKGVITKSNLPDADYVINPYIGCAHGCIYCYAEFMKRFTNHKEEWGCFVDVKMNALKKLGNINKLRNKKILFSSVTDPYQSVEAKYELTRNILKKLICVQPEIGILTKSQLVTRDIDVFKKFEKIEVGISISTLKYYKQLEPLASQPEHRIKALKKISQAGIRTYVFISPILPSITDYKRIMKKTKFADYFMFENINVQPNNKNKILEFVKKTKPDALKYYEKEYDWKKLEKEITENYNNAKTYFHHDSFKKRQAQSIE
ncbi:MAG: radical SAM protein [Nanoarchaeota archaeon]|nr:radical SAM protein [Nanoarchaeota archaeon]